MGSITVLVWKKENKDKLEKNGFVLMEGPVDKIQWDRDVYGSDRVFIKDKGTVEDIELLNDLLEWDCEIEFYVEGEIGNMSGHYVRV